MAFPDDWSYRKSFTMSRASGAVTNYQMKLLVGESAGATGENVDCGGLCKTDFSDLRFTAADGTTLLDYWIESVSGATPNQLATVWIEFDSIGTGATTFYMYYGNTGAAAVSSGDNTFLLFDHFDGSLDTAKWDNVSSATINISGSVANVTTSSDAWRGLASDQTFAIGKRFRALGSLQMDAAAYNSMGFTGANAIPGTNCAAFYYGYGALSNQRAKVRNAKADAYTEGTDFSASASENMSIYELNWCSAYVKGYLDGTLKDTLTTNVPVVDLKATAGVADNPSGKIQWDWVFVSSFVDTEPAWGSWGFAENLGVAANQTQTIMIM